MPKARYTLKAVIAQQQETKQMMAGIVVLNTKIQLANQQ
jgi:hypothetical protein